MRSPHNQEENPTVCESWEESWFGSVNNFGTSRENREMGQDPEWDNGDEATTTSATVQKYTM